MERLLIGILITWFYSLTPFFSTCAYAEPGYVRGGAFASQTLENDDFFGKIQPIFERRCVVCHSCFEAPCQLKLTSPQLLMRGATQHITTGHLTASLRTDLLFTLAEQRKGGFYSVIPEKPGQDSLMGALLKEGNDRNGLPPEEYVPPEKRQCVASTVKWNELNSLEKKKLGMPYYMAPIEEQEYKDLTAWIDKGAPLPSEKELDVLAQPKSPKVIQHWEDFMNAPAWKARWTSRYLYEHLFTAHLYFEESPGEFYEIVRSKTAAPEKIEEIAAERPYTMPSEWVNDFSYRLRKVQQTIVQKQHFVYKISKNTISELQKLFWEPKWNSSPEAKPFSFEDRNPFIAFEHIPANSRYRWMLKNAKMLLDMDMRSDNCHGEGATGPLHESFLVLFLKPESDVTVQIPDFFKYANPYLGMTNVSFSNVLLQAEYKSNQVAYSKIKQHYQQHLFPKGLAFEDIWNGEQGTQMPLFTITHHEKTASVHDGAFGPQQRVSLLFDYATFERLYYNCVALTTLFDKITDKMGTVWYLRDVGREVEEQMLSFIPEDLRETVRAEWIQGEGTRNRYDDSRFALPFNENLLARKDLSVDPKRPFESMMDYMLLKSGRFTQQIVGNNHYPISKGSNEYYKFKALSEYMSQEIVAGEGHRAQHFPNISYIAVEGPSGVHYYTVVANRYYDYVNYIPYRAAPADKLGRHAAKDYLTIFQDIQINYPGKIYVVKEAEVESFMNKMKSVSSREKYVKFDKTYGLQKMSPQFWQTIDAIQSHFIQLDPINNGILDLGEYGVHDLLGSP